MIEFTLNNIIYQLHFDKYEQGKFELLILNNARQWQISLIKRYKDGKVIWNPWDYTSVDYEAQKYCDKIIKNLAFI